MNKEIKEFQNILKEAYEKGENEQVTVYELVEELEGKLREMLGESIDE